MQIGKIKVSPFWSASGVQGFFESDRYWYQKILRWLGIMFYFHTFTSKTSTLAPREGNMPFEEDGITPKEWFPKCIVIKWWKRAVLNAVGLSGPGLEALLYHSKWQDRTKPFFISIMSVAPTREERVKETRAAIALIMGRLSTFKTNIGIQLNVSCPNVGVHQDNIVTETFEHLNSLLELDPENKLTVVVKLAPTVTPFDAAAIATHRRCDGLCLGNTVPYGQLPDDIDWVYLFGSADPQQSPLIKERGLKQPGGYSGPALNPVICRLIREVRRLGVKKHINACGGITGVFSAFRALHAGADSISFSTGVFLNPPGLITAMLTAHVYTFFRSVFR